MQDRSTSPPLGNILMFVLILVLAFFVYPWLMGKFFPKPKPINVPVAQDGKDGKGDKKAAADKVAADKAAEEKKPGKEKNKPDGQANAYGKDDKSKAGAGNDAKVAEQPDKQHPNKAVAQPEKKPLEPRQWRTLGSVDPDPNNPYRMLVTVCNEGASLARVELSSERYRDLEDRSGYLGHLVMDNSDKGPGCLVQVVGAGTPAAEAGVKRDDRILELVHRGQKTKIDHPAGLESALRPTKPGETIELVVQRGKDTLPNTSVRMIRRPLEVIRPERSKPSTVWISGGQLDAISLDDISLDGNCPPSLLTSLQQVDGDKLRTDEDPEAKMEEELTQQLPGVELRHMRWKIDGQESDQPGGPITKVAFSCVVPKYQLQVTKTYELVKVDGDPAIDVDAKAYHLVLTLQVTNRDSKPHDVAYRQDGPNGLPVEGAWYATKVQKTGLGLRDIVYQLNHRDFEMVACSELSEKSDKGQKFRKDLCESTQFTDDHLPLFFGVDAQYFSAALLPKLSSTAPTIDRVVALRVGQINDERKTLTNTTFRIIGKTTTIKPGESSAPQSYELFAGPKRPTLLAKYEMQGLVYYGWPIFQWVAVPMTHILDFFYAMVHNYGFAIIMLTIVVRLAMFPMSRKQAHNAQMMQKIQPEMKEIQKKFKKDPEGARKAQQELWSKHNYNPFGGCLLLFIQMPIFLGLYRALQVNVELRDAPLITHAIRWCSNLAAPDMLYDWSWFMPNAINSGIGYPWFPLLGSMAGLGPYL
ncbi:MAG: YidC/Oxa1 family insertase periplasmic-domain containing protein, partial [Thermoguttaceae bacterium]